MKKLTKAEEAYRKLSRFGRGPVSEEAIGEIKRALNGNISLLVAKAADIVSNWRLHDLLPDLTAAFHRFLVNNGKADKQCTAKTSIINALNNLEYLGDDVYLAGVQYVQMEPVWGGQADTAIEVRCGCAFGLARINYPDVHYVLADLLVDHETSVRVAAVKALAYMGTPESDVMLRLKVLVGDSEIEVIGECFTALMTIIPKQSLGFVSRYLKHNDLAIVESAALAIGGSHIPEAFETLKNCWEENPILFYRRAIMLSIALIRSDDAFDFLLDVVRNADTQTAAQAISTLKLYASDRTVEKITKAVESRNDSDLADRFKQEFGERVDGSVVL